MGSEATSRVSTFAPRLAVLVSIRTSAASAATVSSCVIPAAFKREVERERLPHDQLNTGHFGLSKAGEFGRNRVSRRFQGNDEVVTLVGRDDLPLFTCPIVPYC